MSGKGTKVLRDAVHEIRKSGGTEVQVFNGGKHTHIHFVNAAGRKQIITLHRGNIVSWRTGAWLRAQLRSGVRP